MRYIGDVIDEMLKKIPETEFMIIKDFNFIKHAAMWKAPEDWAGVWRAAQVAIQNTLGPKPTQDWHYEILSIWMVKTVEELKEMFK